MYGDHFRSTGRDDEDGAGPRRAPWESGSVPPPPAHEDVKVAGSPTNVPPGPSATGEFDTSGYEPNPTGAYATPSLDAESTNPYGTGRAAHDAEAAAAYGNAHDGGPEPTPYDGGPYEPGQYEPAQYESAHYEPAQYEGGPHEPAATAAYDGGPYEAAAYDGGPNPAGPYEPGPGAAPAFGAEEPPGPDFEDMRRTPRSSGRKMIKIAAVAAAVVVVGGGGAAWAMTGSSGGGGGKKDAPPVQAQAPAPAPLTDAQRKDAADQRRKELKKRASRAARDEAVRPRLMAKGTPPPTKKPTEPPSGGAGDPVPASEAQKIARAMLPSYGWSPSSQFGCLVNLWNRESHWNVHAANPSGAYGIPQALPGSKMASAGPDWQNNARTQIKWGLGYIKGRYSTPCGAWAHSQSTGWY